ncbi:hypothetical protein MXB_2430 [Myxobolus squamalis]|nr:hypothetical protein MXB_2430 [Myxobolus squamalis]
MVCFQRKLWKNQSTDDSDGNARTNNCLERYNSRLRKRFTNTHPNIFAFINVIKEEDQYFTNLTRGVRLGVIPNEVNFSHELNFIFGMNFV